MLFVERKYFQVQKLGGAPGTIRTSDPQIRSLIPTISLIFLDFP